MNLHVVRGQEGGLEKLLDIGFRFEKQTCAVSKKMKKIYRSCRIELTAAIHCDVLYDLFQKSQYLKKTFSDDIQITYQLLNTVTDHLPASVFSCVCA